MRMLTAAMRAALAARRVPLATFIDFDHPAGREFLWSGLGRVSWAGRTWTGVGDIGRIGGVSETSDMGVQRVTFDLHRVEPAEIQRLVSIDVTGREVIVWRAVVDGLEVVPDPVEVARFDLSTPRVERDDEGNQFLRFTALSGLWALERPVRRALTDAEQQREFPGDTGFSRLSEQAKRTYNWRRT